MFDNYNNEYHKRCQIPIFFKQQSDVCMLVALKKIKPNFMKKKSFKGFEVF